VLKINERTIEAVAALLYNNIYNLSHPSEGAWSLEERRDDRGYLAFAQGLLQAVRDTPDASDEEIMQRAVQLTRQNPAAGFAWETIVIDQEYFDLPEQAATYLPEIRAFITHRGRPAYIECEFLDLDLDDEDEEHC
jgi:hypothetical protein